MFMSGHIRQGEKDDILGDARLSGLMLSENRIFYMLPSRMLSMTV